MSSSSHVVMKNINKGARMFTYIVLHGTAQSPVGKAQNQAQKEPQRNMYKTPRYSNRCKHSSLNYSGNS